MKKLLTVASAAALMASMLNPSAEAKLQKLDISGKLFISGVQEDNRNDFNDNTADSNAYLQTDAELRFDGQMSDNVSFKVEIENSGRGSEDVAGQSGAEDALEVRQAYLQLAEFLNPKLTVKVGVQEFTYDLRGNGDAFGLDLDAAGVKASWNADPVYIDLFSATQTEGSGPGQSGTASDDVGFTGINVDYWMDKNLMTGSIINFRDQSTGSNMNYNQFSFGVNYFFPNVPVEIFSEIGIQAGEVNATTDVDATAGNFGARYSWKNVANKPYVELGYRFRSGNETAGTDNETWNHNGAWSGADTAGLTSALLLEDSEYYGAGLTALGRSEANRTSGSVSYRLVAGVQPTDAVRIDAGVFFFETSQTETIGGRQEDELGTEFDVVASWQYSEDLLLRAGFGYVDADTVLAGSSTIQDEATLLFWDANLSF